MTDDCSLLFTCEYNISDKSHSKCEEISLKESFFETINETSSDPDIPVAFGNIYGAYDKQIILNSNNSVRPYYVCYNDRLCSRFYSNRELLLFNNTVCRIPEDFPLSFDEAYDVRLVN